MPEVTMFRRTQNGLPNHPQYPLELAELGYKVTEGGELRDKNGVHFDYFHTDNDCANELRKEAMHDGARKIVKGALSDMGVKPLFIQGDSVFEIKPPKGHITLLTTKLNLLKQKKDIIIIVGEHTQDAGIWSYRSLLGEAGIPGGSAVGLMSMLEQWGPEKENGTGGCPGVIMLNPGQLNYSPSLDENMSLATWLARGKEDALRSSIRIDTFHNRVRGHYFPDEHVMTVFDQILPKITRDDARFYLVGISDGGEAMLKCINCQLRANRNNPIGTKIEAIALLQPSHYPHEITSPGLANLLAARGRSWVMSDETPGTLLRSPGTPGQNISATQYANDTRDSKGTLKHPKHVRHGSTSSISEPIQVPTRRRNTVTNDTREKLSSTVFQRNPIFSGPSIFQDACLSQPPYTGPSLMNGVKGHVFNPPLSAVPSAVWSTEGGSSQGAASSSPQSQNYSPLPSPLTMKSVAPYLQGSDKKAAQEEVDRGLAGCRSPESLPDFNDGYFVTESTLAEDAVSVPTFSVGPEAGNVVECVWPVAMPSVLQWFRQLRDDAVAADSDLDSASYHSLTFDTGSGDEDERLFRVFLNADSGSTDEDKCSLSGSFGETWEEVKETWQRATARSSDFIHITKKRLTTTCDHWNGMRR